MKALIISFFCVILGYSFFFDKKDTEKRSGNSSTGVFVPFGDREAVAEPRVLSDSVGYFAKQKNLIYIDEFSEDLF